MNYYASHSQRLKFLENRLGADCPTISWQGNPYSCIPGTVLRRSDASAGGFQLNADFQFDALVSDFLTDTIITTMDLHLAMNNTRIGYLADVYRVRGVSFLPGGLIVRVECFSESENA